MAVRREGLTIGQVSEVLGVPVPTLRSWHLRYGLALPVRTPGGHRRYGPEQVQVLQAMRAAVGRGLAASSAAQALRTPRIDPGMPLSLLTQSLERATGHDQDGLLEMLDRAEQAMGLDLAVDRLLIPLVSEIGDRWERGEVDIAVEHLATTAVRRWVARRTATSTLHRKAAPVLLAAGPGNHHTVALEAFGMLLHCRGWPTRQLGADTPVAALLRAVEATGAQAVVVTAQQVSRRRAVLSALEALRRHPVRLWHAGAAFDNPRHRRKAAGTYLGTVLPEAADALVAELRPA